MAGLLLDLEYMSRARPIIEDTSMMLTRRVRGRVFLLRPGKLTDRIVRYVVAVEAAAMGIEIHAIVVMSNHWHVCLTDPLGNIIDFQRNCHAFITRALNAHFGEFEAVWASRQGSRVECEEADDLIREIAYTMGNPVKAGLVRHGKSWPGVRHAWPRQPINVTRPPKFFRGQEHGGKWPKTVKLVFTRPPGYDELADDELADLINETVNSYENKQRAKADAQGKSFIGRRAVLAQRRHSRPSTLAPHFRGSPQVVCRNRGRRVARLHARRQWREDYCAAMNLWRSGVRDVLFPYGTYKMRRVHNVACDLAPN